MLKSLFFILLILYSFSILKNIQYPLLWNDEAETAMLTRRTMQFGYPKVHDGKNTLYMIRLPKEYKDVAINKDTDAYVGIPWAMIYFGLIGESLASLTDDIYLKTGLLRLPFALIGLLGLMLLGYSVSKFIEEKYKHHFWIVYLLLLMTNIHLTLHLREVRYYSLVIFTGAVFFHIFLKYRLLEKILSIKYLLLITLLLWFSFHVFSPLYFAIATFVGVWEIGKYFKLKDSKQFIKGISPSIISFILLIPIFIFFKSFEHSAATAETNYFNSLLNVKEHFFYISHYFINYENIWLTIILLILLFILLRKGTSYQFLLRKELAVLTSLMLCFLVYLGFASAIPIKVYTRYFIILLPLLCVITALIFSITFQNSDYNKIVFIISMVFFFNYQFFQSDNLKGRYKELTQQYKGVLDYTIPFIMENYDNTENLVIAANYEECAYMYYLDSKVTYGYVGNNLAEDSLITPDIVAYRKSWSTLGCMKESELLKFKEYKTVEFPIYDFAFNNNPEFKNEQESHLFETKLSKEERRAYLLIK